ncbi:MAG: alpha/beta hydrolase-fold protein [Planctomycetota bacterium]
MTHAQSGTPLVYDDGSGNTLPYRLFLPPGINDPGAEFPLVVHLHGAGERGTNNTAQLAFIDGLIDEVQTENPAILVVPQAPSGSRWENFGSDDFTLPMQLTVEVLEEVEQLYSVDPTRRYVTGLSMGGFGTWELLGKKPGYFAAGMPLSAGGQPFRAPEYAQSRVWAHHGAGDNVVPVVPMRETIQAIRDEGAEPLYSEVQGGHGIWRPIYDDPTGEIYDWLFNDVAPPLSTWTYDSSTGDVVIDANAAPGGSIFSFRYAVSGFDLFDLPDNVLLDGVPVATDDFFAFTDVRTLIYSDSNRVGFSGVLELPGLLPTGLDFLSLQSLVTQHFYFSPETDLNRRYFDIVVTASIPEPTALAGVMIVVGLGAARRRVR